MTPLQFEQQYEADWAELESLVDRLIGRKRPRGVVVRPGPLFDGDGPVSGARLATLYRRACEHLALARGRAYPAYMVDRLERVTIDAHQLIYQRRDYGLARLRRFAAADFPAAVRRHRHYMLVSALTFFLPAIVIGILVYTQPEMVLSVVSAQTASSFEEMYSPATHAIGRERDASSDWMMFGYYIRNNIGVAFQCFAGGLFAGLGSLFFLAFNGAFGGAVAGFVTSRGLGPTFYSFVVTHSAFEITAILIAGAAGLRIGHAWLAPGRQTRLQALVDATRSATVLLYGAALMLVVAAMVEAFWSSAAWIPHGVKYGVAALCWAAVAAYFLWQGRRAG